MILRRVLAIAAGVVVFMLVVVLFDALGSAVFPTPPGFDPSNPDALSEHIANIPDTALAVVLLGSTAAAFAGAYATAMLIGAGGAVWGFGTGAVALIATSANALRLPHPVWFVAAAPLGVIAATVLAVWLSSRKHPVKRVRTPPARAA